ncbi:hypothetical protein B0H16DRAFT_1700797 [Mycena metata]|uniref:Uncharacterized protein n=1 Tax=Mycena metata TaxID=1033252 RepID=A0AAD7MHN0_9AGAR|nr:hypothetical protein B0H16DRAFT_1700797 [Mycena metata]
MDKMADSWTPRHCSTKNTSAMPFAFASLSLSANREHDCVLPISPLSSVFCELLQQLISLPSPPRLRPWSLFRILGRWNLMLCSKKIIGGDKLEFSFLYETLTCRYIHVLHHPLLNTSTRPFSPNYLSALETPALGRRIRPLLNVKILFLSMNATPPTSPTSVSAGVTTPRLDRQRGQTYESLKESASPAGPRSSTPGHAAFRAVFFYLAEDCGHYASQNSIRESRGRRRHPYQQHLFPRAGEIWFDVPPDGVRRGPLAVSTQDSGMYKPADYCGPAQLHPSRSRRLRATRTVTEWHLVLSASPHTGPDARTALIRSIETAGRHIPAPQPSSSSAHLASRAPPSSPLSPYAGRASSSLHAGRASPSLSLGLHSATGVTPRIHPAAKSYHHGVAGRHGRGPVNVHANVNPNAAVQHHGLQTNGVRSAYVPVAAGTSMSLKLPSRAPALGSILRPATGPPTSNRSSIILTAEMTF